MVLCKYLIAISVLFSTFVHAEELFFFGMGEKPAREYAEHMQKIKELERCEDCTNMSERIKVRLQVVQFRQWALGHLSYSVRIQDNFESFQQTVDHVTFGGGYSTPIELDTTNIWVPVLKTLNDDQRKKITSAFFDKVEKLSQNAEPQVTFGQVIDEASKWLVSDLLPSLRDELCGKKLTETKDHNGAKADPQ